MASPPEQSGAMPHVPHLASLPGSGPVVNILAGFEEMDIESLIGFLPFMDLDEDIQRRILRLVLLTNFPIDCDGTFRPNKPRTRKSTFNVNVLRVNRHIQDIGRKILYEENVFSIDMSMSLPDVSRFIRPWVGLEGFKPDRPQALNKAPKIKHIQFLGTAATTKNVTQLDNFKQGHGSHATDAMRFQAYKLLKLFEIFFTHRHEGAVFIRNKRAMMDCPTYIMPLLEVSIPLSDWDRNDNWCCPAVEQQMIRVARQEGKRFKTDLSLCDDDWKSEINVHSVTLSRVPSGKLGYHLVKTFEIFTNIAKECHIIDIRGVALKEENEMMVTTGERPNDASFPSFMELPTELKRKILEYALVGSPEKADLIMNQPWMKRFPTGFVRARCTSTRNLLVTCKLIFHLSRSILSEKTIFDLPMSHDFSTEISKISTKMFLETKVLMYNKDLDASLVPFRTTVKHIQVCGYNVFPHCDTRSLQAEEIIAETKEFRRFFDQLMSEDLELHSLTLEIGLLSSVLVQELLSRLRLHEFLRPTRSLNWIREPRQPVRTSKKNNPAFKQAPEWKEGAAWILNLDESDETRLRLKKIVLDVAVSRIGPGKSRAQWVSHHTDLRWMIGGCSKKVFGSKVKVTYGGTGGLEEAKKQGIPSEWIKTPVKIQQELLGLANVKELDE